MVAVYFLMVKPLLKTNSLNQWRLSITTDICCLKRDFDGGIIPDVADRMNLDTRGF